MKYYVYGVGKEATILYTTRFLESIDGFIDDDENKQGKIIFDRKIYSLEDILQKRDGKEDVFIVVSCIYSYEKISQKRIKSGLDEVKDFVWGPNWLGNDTLPSTYDFRTWESLDQERDYSIWNNRTGIALEMLETDCKSILDLGAGGMCSLNFISPEIAYYPVDFFKRYPETIVCDLNKGEFPEQKVDCVLALGILQYIEPAEKLIENICNCCNSVIFSYSTILEASRNFAGRQRRGVRNNYKLVDIIKMFIRNDFLPQDERLWEGYDCCIKFVRSKVFWKIENKNTEGI